MTTSDNERQRIQREKRKDKVAQMPKIPCACGCGTLIAPCNSNYVPHFYVKGHNRSHSGLTGRPAHNRIGNAPLTGYEKTKRYLARRYAEIDQMPKIPCACGCGTLIAPINKLLKPAKYAKNHHQKGARNKRWRGGLPLRYGAEFTVKYKRLILQRDNWTCQRCGITQDAHGKTLQVHHLDHDTMNNDPTNLVAACNKCNMWASNHRDDPFIQS